MKSAGILSAMFNVISGTFASQPMDMGVYRPLGSPVVGRKKKRAKRAAERRREKAAKVTAGAKLLKAFNRSGNRAQHASKPQNPCYGRRSERAA